MKARIEPMAGDDLDIPMPAMTPAYRVGIRRPSPRVMDPATRRLAIFAGAIGGALVLLVGIWSFTGHHRQGVPVIEAQSGPVKVKPANPGGLQIAGANDAILSGESDGKDTMAPPPETPEPQVLKAEEHAAAAPPPKPAESTATAAAATALAVPPPAAADARPVATTEAKPTPLTPPAAHREPAARTAAGGAMVQLAAVDSEEAARGEWRRLEHRYRGLLDGRTPTFTRTEHGGHIYWRVRTGGFADTAQAAVFCERVKQKGGGCAVASF